MRRLVLSRLPMVVVLGLAAACASQDNADVESNAAATSGRLTAAQIDALARPDGPALTEAEATTLLDARYNSDAGVRAHIPQPTQQYNFLGSVWVRYNLSTGFNIQVARRSLGAKMSGGDIWNTRVAMSLGANGRKALDCGFAVEDVQTATGGYYNHFSVCSLFASTYGVFEVHGAMRQKYSDLGWETGIGFPKTDDRVEADGVGHSQRFEFAAIYNHPSAGLHWVKGGILQTYEALGAAGGALGYPTGDEGSAAGGGYMNTFQNGTIYWLPATGGHSVRGAILAAYQKKLSAGGDLGYPTSEQQAASDGSIVQSFQGGTITVTNGTARIRYDQVLACPGGKCAARPCAKPGQACCPGGQYHDSGCESFTTCKDKGELKVCELNTPATGNGNVQTCGYTGCQPGYYLSGYAKANVAVCNGLPLVSCSPIPAPAAVFEVCGYPNGGSCPTGFHESRTGAPTCRPACEGFYDCLTVTGGTNSISCDPN